MLDKAQIRALRARAHHLKPVVTVGEAGPSPALLAELDAALAAHGLLKVRLPALERAAREALTDHLCRESGAERVQTLGRVAVLFRPREEGEASGEAPGGHS